MNVYEIVTEKIISKLEAGEIPWKQPWKNDGSAPANLVSKKPYRGINTMLLPRTYSSNFFVSFKQAKELGGMVKQGETGHLVTFWKMLEAADAKDPKKQIPLLRYYTVFNVDQTTIPADRLPPKPPMNEINPIEECEKTIANMPNRPEIKEGECRAYYRPATDTVNMPQRGLFENAERYYATLFHEIGHSTGHASRLDREGISHNAHGFGSKTYSREELVAEMTSAFLCGHCSIDTAPVIEGNAAYVQSWIRALKEDSKAVVVAAGQAQKAADYVLGKIEIAPKKITTATQIELELFA